MATRSSPPTATASRTTFRALLPAAIVCALVAFAVRVGFFLIYQPAETYSALGTDLWLQTARNLIDGHGYSAPYPGMPTALRGPAAVYYFAAILTLFGEGFWPIVLCQSFLDALTSMLLFFLAVEIFGERRTAIVGALLFAFYGPGAFLCLNAWSEPLFTCLLAAGMLVFVKVWKSPSRGAIVGCGALLGLATLARPSLLLVPFVLAPFLLWRERRRPGRALVSATLFGVAFGVVLLPWIVRNALVFDTFIPGTSAGGATNYQSHYFLAEDDYLRYRPAKETTGAMRALIESRYGASGRDIPEFWRFLQHHGIGEVEMSRMMGEEAWKVIRAHPERYATLVLLRFVRLWFNLGLGDDPSTESYLVATVNGFALLFALVALIFLRGPWVLRSLPLLALVAYHTAIHMALFAIVRYSAPVAPYVLLFASRSAVALLDRFAVLRRRSPGDADRIEVDPARARSVGV